MNPEWKVQTKWILLETCIWLGVILMITAPSTVEEVDDTNKFTQKTEFFKTESSNLMFYNKLLVITD